MAGDLWTIVEAQSFRSCLPREGGVHRLQEALAPVRFALQREPLAFPETSLAGIYLARSRLHIGRYVVPALNIRFRVDVERRTVELLHVEIVKDDGWPEDDWL